MDEALFLDVNCTHSAAGYSILIRLSAEEAAKYAQDGRTYLGHLAEQVQNAGPGQGDQLRDVTVRYAEETRKALEDWRMQQ